MLQAISDADRAAVQAAAGQGGGKGGGQRLTASSGGSQHLTTTHSTNYRTSTSSSSLGVLSPSRVSSSGHLPGKETFTAAPSSVASGPVVHVRHHPDGNLSVDFTSQPHPSSEIELPAASVPLPTPSKSFSPKSHPLSHHYTPRPFVGQSYPSSTASTRVPTSASSAYSLHREDHRVLTPSSHSVRGVQFASDTKAR